MVFRLLYVLMHLKASPFLADGSTFVLMEVETLGVARSLGWKVHMRCANGYREGTRSMRRCVNSKQLGPRDADRVPLRGVSGSGVGAFRQGRVGQMTTVGNPTRLSSLRAAMVSRVMHRVRWTAHSSFCSNKIAPTSRTIASSRGRFRRHRCGV